MKQEELRRYGPRWDEKTCEVGREVTLSCGYGSKRRAKGIVTKFKKQHGTLFGSTYKDSILAVYGTLDIFISCIQINCVTEIINAKK